MPLTKVTITGADDASDPRDMAALSGRFPFVEWGILVSSNQEGSYRFPSRTWVDRFSAIAEASGLSVSTHVCGRWAREMLTSNLDWRELPFSLNVSQRVQINTHSEPRVSAIGIFKSLSEFPEKQFIFLGDGFNNHLAFLMQEGYGVNVAVLFDTSGGAGILPGSWPEADLDIPCGYAGGLGPDNVVEQIADIETVCPYPYWIDMERRVRSEDDSFLDMEKVERVLERVEPFVVRDR